MIAPEAYRPLRVLLFVISGIEGIAGVVFLFATSWVLSFAPPMLALPYTAFVVALVKALGIVAIALGYLLYTTARDPVRYVAVIDALIFLLVAAAALNIYAVIALHLGSMYPTPYLATRAVVQLILALALIALRPRAISSTQPAHDIA